jgi:MFS family permease
MGIGSGGLWMAVTLSTLDRWPGQEYLCMSRIFAAYSIGGLLGPALGALGGVQAPFVAYTALTVVGLILAIAMGRTVTPRIFATDRAVLRLPAFWAASAGILFAVLALGVIEGVLPLLFARQLSQPQIALVLAGVAIVVAVAAATAARFGARAALLGAAPFIVFGIGIVGASGTLPMWLVGLAIAAVGVGLANTGSIGVLLAGVPIERSMTALVVWSQIGIVGYLAGPLIGGASAEAFGYPVLGAVLFLSALPLLILTISSARPPAAALHGGST